MSDIKSTKERQKEILDAAELLFASKGYDATSVSDIMKAVGIAKGTLYYHFSSKEEILDALIAKMVDQMVGRAHKILVHHDLSVTQKMIQMILAMNVTSHGEGDIIKTLHNPQNALLHQKSYQLSVERMTPILTEVVKEGIEQDLFATDFPEAAVHMALTYSMVAFKDVQAIEVTLIQGFIYNLERLLGAKPGTLDEFYKCF